jgi:hypothetical protein
MYCKKVLYITLFATAIPQTLVLKARQAGDIIAVQDLHSSRQAVHYALNLLDSQTRVQVLEYLEAKCGISLYTDTGPIDREDVNSALQQFFAAAADLLMKRYDHCLQMSDDVRQTLLGFM